LVIGYLNIITITFAVMILGLGEDLGVQFISRYEEGIKPVRQPGSMPCAPHYSPPALASSSRRYQRGRVLCNDTLRV